MIKHIYIIAAMLLTCVTSVAQRNFTYKGEKLTTGRHCYYVDDRYKNDVKKFTFHSVTDALHFAEQNNGRDPQTTVIYIAPSVYWLDNPDENVIRRPDKGEGTPYALKLKFSNIRLTGLSENPEDVIFAVNRGQTQGADGNFTMLHITGSNIEAENITFGNYCNVDLLYPRNPKLNRSKRKNAVVQAQIAICKGDGYSFRNCRFISRLNLCPFIGAPHTEYRDCYFECTDDALCGTGTYRHCRFTLFSSKPFYSTYGEGARLFDCDIHCKTHGTQYMMKASGPMEIRDCRFTSDDPDMNIQWTKRPDPKNYCVMSGCTLNGRPLTLTTPTEPLSRVIPAMPLQVQHEIIPGKWTMDNHKPLDTMDYPWEEDNSSSSWGYAEGVDGAEGSWGLVELKKGARLMLTPMESASSSGRHATEPVVNQNATVVLDPCKGPGQGFGSATGQYLDICIKFDTRTLTGYGIRFIRTPEYDHAVETCLVEYTDGRISRISEPVRCDLFKPTCMVTLTADATTFTAKIEHIDKDSTEAEFKAQELTAIMPHPNTFAGFHIQHTGSVGASATVIRSITLKP